MRVCEDVCAGARGQVDHVCLYVCMYLDLYVDLCMYISTVGSDTSVHMTYSSTNHVHTTIMNYAIFIKCMRL